MYDPILDGPITILDGLKTKISPQILATILNRNVSYIYQEAQAGRLPDIKNGEYTYLECIQHYIEYYKSAQDLKIKKLDTEIELKKAKQEAEVKYKNERKQNRGMSLDGGEDASPLMVAKMKQDIRVGIAKEAQMWQKTLIERGDYLNLERQVELAEPFIMLIKNTLVALSRLSPEAETLVDEAMENLYNFGILLTEGAIQDKKDFVETILAKDIDIDEIEVDSEVPSIL